jgi:exosortase
MKTFFKRYSAEIIVGTLFLLSYLPAIIWMWERWFARDSYYSHGILVRFVSVYLIWLKRDELRNIKVRPSSWGIVLMATGVGIYIFSSALRIYFSSIYSMMVVLVGMILHFYGREALRKILFPVLFLFFMMPLPLVIVVNISFKMKLFAAELARQLLNSMGLMAVREGSIIKMAHTYVVVDDICSGLRSLISLAALGSIFAYLLQATRIKRVLLFLSTVPIAIITNVCRIVFLSAVSEIWGPKYATGFIHDLSGYSIFALAFAMLYGVSKMIE